MKSNNTDLTLHLFGGNTKDFSWVECWQGIVQEEKDKASKMRHLNDQRTSVIVRAQLRKCLSEFMGIPPLEIDLAQNAFGKSLLQNSTHPSFSVAHTEHTFVIAVSEFASIGVDIESVSRECQLEKITAVLLTPEEHHHWKQCKESTNDMQQLLKLWTQKEALVKTLGTSLEKGMQTFQLWNDGNVCVPNRSEIRRDNHCYTVLTDSWMSSFFISIAIQSTEFVQPNIEFHTLSNKLHYCA
jgi:phosphopantetheine--protein transferase-like protein